MPWETNKNYREELAAFKAKYPAELRREQELQNEIAAVREQMRPLERQLRSLHAEYQPLKAALNAERPEHYRKIVG